MQELEVGQIRKGIVKNIADFGAFVDLGGIDGLLHITDMAWERIGHPSEMVAIDQEIEVKVLHIDREKQKIALGLKQKDRNPWDNVADKYPVGSVHMGEVVNVMSYGAFVKLEAGHRRPGPHQRNELDQAGQSPERTGQHRRQDRGQDPQRRHRRPTALARHEADPAEPVGRRAGTLPRRYRRRRQGSQPHQLRCVHRARRRHRRPAARQRHVLDAQDQPSERAAGKGPRSHLPRAERRSESRRRIALGLKQLDNDPWDNDIPDKYQPGQLVKGKVTKITNFGVFVGLEDGLEGLLHISELADHKVDNPEEMVKVGDEIEVKVLRVDTDERKIGLSRKRVDWDEDRERAAAAEEAASTGSAVAQVADSELKGGLGSGDGPLFRTGN